jgi:hypothetical protein
MRAFAVEGSELRLALADVGPELEPAVRALGFVRAGALFVRTFPGDAPHARAAAGRFEACAEELVAQAAGRADVPWEAALETLLGRRAAADDWWLTGSGALAVRGLAVSPRDLDVIATGAGCARLADALADVLVEPLAGGGHLGETWLRAFASARIECVGGVHPTVDAEEPSDFGPYAAERLEQVEWQGHPLRVPPLELQLRVSERRGLDDRAALIREAMQ